MLTIGEAGEYGKWLLPREELIKTLMEGAASFLKVYPMHLAMILLDKIILRDCLKNFRILRNNISVISLRGGEGGGGGGGERRGRGVEKDGGPIWILIE